MRSAYVARNAKQIIGEYHLAGSLLCSQDNTFVIYQAELCAFARYSESSMATISQASLAQQILTTACYKLDTWSLSAIMSFVEIELLFDTMSLLDVVASPVRLIQCNSANNRSSIRSDTIKSVATLCSKRA